MINTLSPLRRPGEAYFVSFVFVLKLCRLIARSPEHRAATGLAVHVLGVAHPGDRLVLAAIGALGDELEAAEAVDAAKPARQLGRAQPGLTAVGARRCTHPTRLPVSQAPLRGPPVHGSAFVALYATKGLLWRGMGW